VSIPNSENATDDYGSLKGECLATAVDGEIAIDMQAAREHDRVPVLMPMFPETCSELVNTDGGTG
jgi:hypothetical protein